MSGRRSTCTVCPFAGHDQSDLVADQEAHPPFGTIATYPPDYYAKYDQTSVTKGEPLAVMDILDGWAWWVECWQYVYASATSRRYRCSLLSVRSVHRFLERLLRRASRRPRRFGGGADTRSRLKMMQSTCPKVLMRR